MPSWSLLDPDQGAGGDLLGQPLRIQQPDDSGTDQGAALAQTYQTVSDYLAKQRAQSAEMGLWDDQSGHPTGKGLLDAAQQYDNALLMGTTGPSPVRAFHATSEPFETYDWGRLGDYTRKNITDADNPDSWAMRLARLGPWAHEKPLADTLFTGTDLPVELSGNGKAYPSIDKLHDAIAKAGGPEKLRALLTDRGFGHVRVKDEEFGGNSYVGLSPETFKIVQPEE